MATEIEWILFIFNPNREMTVITKDEEGIHTEEAQQPMEGAQDDGWVKFTIFNDNSARLVIFDGKKITTSKIDDFGEFLSNITQKNSRALVPGISNTVFGYDPCRYFCRHRHFSNYRVCLRNCRACREKCRYQRNRNCFDHCFGFRQGDENLYDYLSNPWL